MDVHVVVKLKSSYEAWYALFVNDAENRTKICDESKTLVGKVDNVGFHDNVEDTNQTFLQ